MSCAEPGIQTSLENTTASLMPPRQSILMLWHLASSGKKENPTEKWSTTIPSDLNSKSLNLNYCYPASFITFASLFQEIEEEVQGASQETGK